MASITASSGVTASGQKRRTSRAAQSIRKVAKHFGKNIVLEISPWKLRRESFSPFSAKAVQARPHCCGSSPALKRRAPARCGWAAERLDVQPPYRRRVNTVFQHYALFPHLTVEQNVGYGLARGQAARSGNRRTRGGSVGHGQDDSLRQGQAGKDQRRTAAAHRARPRAGEPATAVAAGRATFRAGCQSASPNAGGTEIAAARSRHRVRVRHA